jgi:predicted ATPase
MDLEPRTIGPYRVVSRLGQGGMGVVYRGEDPRHGEAVAIKTVRVPHHGMLASIRREIHALARLRHPGIVRILAEGVEQGLPWYAMELLEGVTLRRLCLGTPRESRPGWWTQVLERQSQETVPAPDRSTQSPDAADPEATTLVGSASGPVQAGDAAGQGGPKTRTSSTQLVAQPTGLEAGDSSPAAPEEAPSIGLHPAARGRLADALTLLRRLCTPLAFLHGEGIVHRDLKPENVFVRFDGVPVLVDFGMMSPFSGEVSREQLDAALVHGGTVAYMAPEQIVGDLVDGRADLYALGCILYELLTGRPPFVGEAPHQVVWKHCYVEPQPPSELVEGVPQQLEDLVLRLLSKRPQERLGHADVVAAALERLGAQNGASAAGPRPRAVLYRPGLAGREAEIETCRQLLDRLHRGQGGVLLIGGESGIGKTRLAMEVARQARRDKAQVLTGECLPEAAAPLGAFRRALQALADRCREGGVEATQRLLGLRGPVLALYEPALSTLPEQETLSRPAVLPPEAARLRLFLYLAQTLEALAADEPLVLVLDDLQWADDLTLDALGFLVRSGRLAQTRLLVAGTYRTEEIGDALKRLAELPEVSRLQVERLTEEAVREMVGSMLALSPAPQLFVRFLTCHSEGNPFFVAEYLRAAVDGGLLWRDRTGQWQVAEPDEAQATEADYEALRLPRSLRELVGRRLEALSEEARQLAEIAAVLGRETDASMLAALAGLSEPAALGPIGELLARQVLEEPEPDRLRFAHDKLREAAYEGLGRGARRELHRAAALGLEARLAGRPDEDLGALGRHWEQAGEPARARRYYLAAARRAVDRYAHTEAERLYRAHLRLLQEPSAESIAARTELSRDVLLVRGRASEALRAQQKVLKECRSLADRAAEGRALGALGRIHHEIGQVEQARAALEQALELHREFQDRRAEGWTLNRLAAVCRAQGRMDEARALFEQALAIAREVGDRRDEAPILNNLATLHQNQGRMDEARSLYEQALALDRELGDRRLEGGTLGNFASLHHNQGRIEEARLLHEQALGIHRDVGSRRDEGIELANLAELHREQGRIQEARGLYEQALAVQREIGNREFEAFTLSDFAVLCHDQGRLDEAGAHLERALAIQRELGDRRIEAYTLSNLASLRHDQGHIDEARSLYRQALTLHRDVGDRQAEGQTLRRQATLERRCQGELEEARRLVQEAESLLGKLGDALQRGLCLCEEAHLAMALGRSGRDLLAEAEQIALSLHLEAGSELNRAIGRVRQAQEAVEAGRSLFRGEILEDLPEGLQRWLIENRQRPGSAGKPGRATRAAASGASGTPRQNGAAG